ncbi:MAG: hypothetical protein OEQ30_09330 [Gammaproteobacteria bacterium]|jgi:hypothetical protein|nr:hypothetical protein [Gammaproteobacteria bacterium]MDH3756816.1 hypothetical protein [Gammaproteobacteria bacterium]MDH3847404.1 hypothetical protein [Gammaproteobacteria bacterium]MDH3864860.1 hypothetical protein [Gammaproteobacteria bacterium]MDH3906075.1 hypothetical protein [Gammaproteobacteria bacterium]
MKNKLFVLLSLALFASLGSTSALAQDNTRGWEQGYVVQVTEVHTKDGMFNAYINDLSNVWRKFLDAQMEDGDVISYGMYSNVNSREGEPDLFLTVTFKNWAAFDRGVEYFEKLGSQILGSTDEMREANVDRGELRTIGSTYTLRELKFKD